MHIANYNYMSAIGCDSKTNLLTLPLFFIMQVDKKTRSSECLQCTSHSCCHFKVSYLGAQNVDLSYYPYLFRLVNKTWIYLLSFWITSNNRVEHSKSLQTQNSELYVIEVKPFNLLQNAML